MTFLALIAIIFFGFAVYNLTCAFVDIPTKKTSQMMMLSRKQQGTKNEEDDGDERQKSHTLSPPYSMGLLSFMIWVSANRMMAAQIASAILPGVVKIRVWNQSSFKK